MMVGEHDWFFDMGHRWNELFGPENYSFNHKGVHFVVLMSVHEKDFWTARGLSPAERMHTVAGLDNAIQSAFEVGVVERALLKKDLEKVPTSTPIVVFSHSPLYKLYRPWNFWTDDAEDVQAILQRFDHVTVLHGHTHQVFTNRIGNINLSLQSTSAVNSLDWFDCTISASVSGSGAGLTISGSSISRAGAVLRGSSASAVFRHTGSLEVSGATTVKRADFVAALSQQFAIRHVLPRGVCQVDWHAIHVRQFALVHVGRRDVREGEHGSQVEDCDPVIVTALSNPCPMLLRCRAALPGCRGRFDCDTIYVATK